jgi:hypothetical protein
MTEVIVLTLILCELVQNLNVIQEAIEDKGDKATAPLSLADETINIIVNSETQRSCMCAFR